MHCINLRSNAFSQYWSRTSISNIILQKQKQHKQTMLHNNNHGKSIKFKQCYQILLDQHLSSRNKRSTTMSWSNLIVWMWYSWFSSTRGASKFNHTTHSYGYCQGCYIRSRSRLPKLHYFKFLWYKISPLPQHGIRINWTGGEREEGIHPWYKWNWKLEVLTVKLNWQLQQWNGICWCSRSI